MRWASSTNRLPSVLSRSLLPLTSWMVTSRPTMSVICTACTTLWTCQPICPRTMIVQSRRWSLVRRTIRIKNWWTLSRHRSPSPVLLSRWLELWRTCQTSRFSVPTSHEWLHSNGWSPEDDEWRYAYLHPSVCELVYLDGQWQWVWWLVPPDGRQKASSFDLLSVLRFGFSWNCDLGHGLLQCQCLREQASCIWP